jgi:2-oxoglutarate/2-oxoacid ferredoxin oxidoreductase subunit alpha
MSEFIGLGYYAEIPAVVIDVQRAGPSTGLPTRTMQCDTLPNALLSHGDTMHPIYFPSSPEECFSMSHDAFDLAERFQTPVFVNTDLDLGMNNWMSEPFAYPQTSIDRGKVLSAEDLERLGGFARYRDVDGDGVCYRTLPGTNHATAGYFTRGTGHNDKAGYSEREDDFANNLDRLRRKFESIRAALPAPEIQPREGARIGMVYYGTSRYACEEARDQLSAENGVEIALFRVKSWPFDPVLRDFCASFERVYVVEQNRDAQLLSLMRMELSAESIAKLRKVNYFGGLPLDARTVSDAILAQEQEATR